MIKAIIFDLGKVIVPFDFNRAYAGIEAQFGIPIAEIRRRLPQGLYGTFETGLLGPREFAERMAGHLRIQIGYDEFCTIWNSIFLPETLVPDKLIEDLAGKYRLVLLSNTNIIHFEMVRANYPILRHFHATVLSYEAGVMKPAAGIYRKAVEAAGCLAEECVFIDDIPENVEGARLLRIDAVQFLSAAQLEGELEKRGILPL